MTFAVLGTFNMVRESRGMSCPYLFSIWSNSVKAVHDMPYLSAHPVNSENPFLGTVIDIDTVRDMPYLSAHPVNSFKKQVGFLSCSISIFFQIVIFHLIHICDT